MAEPIGRAAALGHWQALEAEFERYTRAVGYIPIAETRLQEDLRRYLCLRCAGFLEQLTYVVLADYLRMKSSDPVLTFANSHFRSAPNLNPDSFTRLLKRFGDDHESALTAFLSTGGRREALGDLLSIRNDIAHGRDQRGQRSDPTRYRVLCEENLQLHGRAIHRRRC